MTCKKGADEWLHLLIEVSQCVLHKRGGVPVTAGGGDRQWVLGPCGTCPWGD